jgi:glycosyltransferase involved in cell wall biosynthesis
MNFSVLMSIYCKENPEYFDRAMHSIWDEQTIQPNEIVLVQDGRLTDELYQSIDRWKEKLRGILKIVSLEENVGLGNALNIGIKKCNNKLIARMDTDDICSKDRFEKQLKVFEDIDIDICSSWVSEFDNDEAKIISYRKLPKNHNDIVNLSKKRSPINHPAVMYKKNIVQNSGGYKKMIWFEDYYLWARMILKGAKFYNIQESLVNMRAGCGQLERRSGLKYAVNEFTLQREFLNLGFINYFEFIRNVFIRYMVRILPKKLVKMIYKKLRN